MSISKPKKSQTPQDIDTLKLDVASFASSIGLSSSSSVPTTNAGFNDSDFRKTGPIKPNTKKPPKPNSHNKNPQKVNNTHVKNQSNYKKENEHKPKHSVVHPLSAENSNSNSKGFDKFKNYPKLPLMKASSLGVWYEDLAELEVKVMGEERKLEVKNVEEWKILVEKNRQVGERLLAQYVQDYEASEGQKGDVKLLVATQRSGTAADKVSAFSVMVEENPIANMRSLDALLALVTAKVGKRHAFPGFDALKELFISRLLPDRKLKSLLQRPVNHISESKDGNSLLLFWYWEECLKQRYERFIVALEEASRDMLPELKDKALKMMSVLLRSKSEQERRLLAALVNKLGDPQKKGASNAGFHLTNILAAHPNMKAVVIDEVDSFLFRPHLGLQSKYHAVNFLTEIRLSHKGEGPKVAKRLIDVYFALFKVLISEAYGNQNMDKRRKGDDRKASNSYKDGKDKISSESHIELDSRLLSALLTGVNRAFPYVSSDEADDIIEVQTPMLFQLVHSKNFNVGVQALMLLDKISSKNQIVSDRFYRALYSKLLLPAAMNSSKAEMFIGLLLRAMKSDVNLKRASAFSKRLLQVALQQPSQYACGFLFLLSEVLKARPPLWNMVLQNESNDDDLEHFDDVVEETENELLATSEKPQSSNGFLHVDNDVDTDAASSEDQDDAPTHHSEDDVPNEADDFVMGDSSIDPQTIKTTDISHGQQPQVSSSNSSLPGGYNPRLREPSFCNADRVSWWELTVLASHAHPSVATMAKTLLSGANIVYNGNPLNDLSLPSFLDKFMEKKPKQSTWHGASQIEPAKKLDMNNHLIGPEILSLAEIDVPPEDLVFHKFYANKMSSTKKPKKKKKKKGAGDEAAEELFGLGGGNDESDNEEIDNMLDSTDPALDADGVYDYDDLDQVANEEDDDLIGDVSDADIDLTSADEGEEVIEATAEDEWSDDNAVSLGDDEDDDDSDGGEDRFNPRKQQRKPLKKTGESPFASLEDYEHLLNEDSPMEETKRRRPKPPLQKKKKKKQKSG